MLRAIPLLVSALLASRPSMPREEATRYAAVLQKVASENQFDPLTAIAIINHESHWVPSVISPDGEDYGLGQVRARYVGACRDDEDPVNAPSEACREVKARLLTPFENIRTMGKIIAANRAFCAKLGLEKTEHWLAGYQGYGSPSRKEFCKPGPMTKDVLDYQAELLAKVSPKKGKRGGAPDAKAPDAEKHAKGDKAAKDKVSKVAKADKNAKAKKAPAQDAKAAPPKVAASKAAPQPKKAPALSKAKPAAKPKPAAVKKAPAKK